MEYRVLGKTGLKIAEVGMGTWQLADDPGCWVGADLSESLKSLYRYSEVGGNFIDTAWIYGYSDSDNRHRSHELIGKFLQESHLRDKLVIASKVPPKNMSWPAKPNVPISQVFPSSWIEKCVDDSLRDLQTDHLDLMQFHVWQDDFAADDGWKQIVNKTIKSGKVRYWGISINDYQPENCLKTLDTGLISSIQLIFNIFHQRPLQQLMPYAQEHQIGLIARVPLDEGGLTGKFTAQTRFAPGDFRSHFFSPSRLTELVAHTDQLKQLLGPDAKTLVELALKFVLSHPQISTVIPGMRKVDYVNSNTAVSGSKPLSPELLRQLHQLSWERNFYL